MLCVTDDNNPNIILVVGCIENENHEIDANQQNVDVWSTTGSWSGATLSEYYPASVLVFIDWGGSKIQALAAVIHNLAPPVSHVQYLYSVVPDYGDELEHQGDKGTRQLVYYLDYQPGEKTGFYNFIFDTSRMDSGEDWHGVKRGRSVPKVEEPTNGTIASFAFDIHSKLTANQLQLKSNTIKKWYLVNQEDGAAASSNLAYLAEAYYFVPMHLALRLQAQGEYTAALDWFRTTYDYSAAINDRKIYYGLKQEKNEPAVYQRPEDWLLDPLNPHEIATTRENTYTRFTVLSIVRCLLEFSDAEFTLDTAESDPHARLLYLTALELLDTPELKQHLGRCSDKIGSIDIQVGDPQWLPVWNLIKAQLADISSFWHSDATRQQRTRGARWPRKLEPTLCTNEQLDRGSPFDAATVTSSDVSGGRKARSTVPSACNTDCAASHSRRHRAGRDASSKRLCPQRVADFGNRTPCSR